jgi:hypothetical protein
MNEEALAHWGLLCQKEETDNIFLILMDVV